MAVDQMIATVNGKGGVGKCLTGDALVADPVSGCRHRLDDMVVDGLAGSVPSMDPATGSPVTADVTARIDSGIQPTLTVTLSSGRTITATHHHPVLAPDGWRPVEQLMVGETIALPTWTPSPTEPEQLDSGEVDLLAVLVAEGSTSTEATSFSTSDPTVLEVATTACERLGIRVQQSGAYDYRLSGGDPVAIPAGECQAGCGTATEVASVTIRARHRYKGQPLRYCSQHQRRFTRLGAIRRHGLDGRLAKHKRIPEVVFRLPQDQLARFLSVLWMCDGTVTVRGEPCIGFASQSLTEDVQHLLLRFGIQSRVRARRHERDGKTFRSWDLRVYSPYVARFEAAFDLWGHKAERLAERAGRASNSNVGQPSCNDELYGRLHSCCPPVGRKAPGQPRLEDVAERLGWDFGTRARFDTLLLNKPRRTGHCHLSLKALAAYCDAFDATGEFGYLYNEDVFWDTVVAVEPAGSQQVFDLTVDETHCFVANDVVVHNTSVSAQLGGLAALSDWRVLLIDLDPQGDLTRNLGYRDRSDDGHALFEAFRSASRPEPLRDVRPNLDVLCGGTRLGRIEDGVTLRNAQANKFAPTQGADKGDDLVAPLSDIADDYDLVIVDCPPNVNSGLTIEALRIARFALIPTMDDDASIDGLERLAQTVAAVRSAEDGNPDLEVLGVVLFNLGGTLPAIERETRATLQRLLGEAVPVFDSTIRTARRAAHDMRQRGLLASEYEDEVDNAPAYHEARRQGLQPPRLAANADGLAADYASLANEALGRFADLLAADEDAADQSAQV